MLSKKMSIHLEPRSLSRAIETLKQKTMTTVENCSAWIRGGQETKQNRTILSKFNCSKIHLYVYITLAKRAAIFTASE